MLSLVQRYYSARIGEGLIYDLRVALFDHVQRMPLAFFTRTQTGALQSRLNNDVIGAQQAVTNTLGTVVSNVIQLVVTLTIMFRLEWRLTLLTLIVLPAFIYPGPPDRPAHAEAHARGHAAERGDEQHHRRAVQRRRRDARQAVRPARPRARRVLATAPAGVRDIGVRTAIYSRILFVALGLVAAVGTAIVYFVGGNLAISGTITSGTRRRVRRRTSAQIYQPLAQLTNSRVDVLTALVSFERVFEVLDFPAAIADRPGAVDLVEPAGPRRARPRVVPPPAGRATSRSRRWRRRARPAATSRATGSCATSRSRSSRARPSRWSGRRARARPRSRCSCRASTTSTQGAVRVDGHDVRDLTLESLHAAIGLVPQDPHLFHDTHPRQPALRARPTRPTPSSTGAARGARIWDLVASLPDGLDTVVGERGYRMSGGEKQRLAIARLLLKDPAIVILDEATSHLDSESELAIQQRVRRGAARPHRDRDRAPPVDDRRRRPHPRGRRRPHRRDRHARRAARPRRRSTPSCTARSSGRTPRATENDRVAAARLRPAATIAAAPR